MGSDYRDLVLVPAVLNLLYGGNFPNFTYSQEVQGRFYPATITVGNAALTVTPDTLQDIYTGQGGAVFITVATSWDADEKTLTTAQAVLNPGGSASLINGNSVINLPAGSYSNLSLTNYNANPDTIFPTSSSISFQVPYQNGAALIVDMSNARFSVVANSSAGNTLIFASSNPEETASVVNGNLVIGGGASPTGARGIVVNGQGIEVYDRGGNFIAAIPAGTRVAEDDNGTIWYKSTSLDGQSIINSITAEGGVSQGSGIPIAYTFLTDQNIVKGSNGVYSGTDPDGTQYVFLPTDGGSSEAQSYSASILSQTASGSYVLTYYGDFGNTSPKSTFTISGTSGTPTLNQTTATVTVPVALANGTTSSYTLNSITGAVVASNAATATIDGQSVTVLGLGGTSPFAVISSGAAAGGGEPSASYTTVPVISGPSGSGLSPDYSSGRLAAMILAA
jgi:hypothetical protein